eukprot:scaffold4838_cov58-Attheya_sp.AAC.2
MTLFKSTQPKRGFSRGADGHPFALQARRIGTTCCQGHQKGRSTCRFGGLRLIDSAIDRPLRSVVATLVFPPTLLALYAAERLVTNAQVMYAIAAVFVSLTLFQKRKQMAKKPLQ